MIKSCLIPALLKQCLQQKCTVVALDFLAVVEVTPCPIISSCVASASLRW